MLLTGNHGESVHHYAGPVIIHLSTSLETSSQECPSRRSVAKAQPVCLVSPVAVPVLPCPTDCLGII